MKNKGITLIALVITIIVLLILAGITINLTIGNQGVITKAQQASKNYKDAEQKEQEELNKFDTELDDIIEGKNIKRIATLEEFTDFRDKVNGGETFEGMTIKLTQDIDLSSVCSEEKGINWEPIGIEENKFKGTFDGNGHTISNLYINSNNTAIALFSFVENSTIENLTVKGTIKSNGNEIAGIVYRSDGSIIDNCDNYVNIEQTTVERSCIRRSSKIGN